ncbi:ABC transporter substrate-binding protein [Nocardia camponoti]|uniref:Leucine-binding protein domain-containing protein n=1 Tax=Nocardia camponoti TaxID=1616106 RepID=A0A917V6Z9_9NOCA|nr:ABC transporter substrate-binding protein [Nocardia camponoti]GGK44950.1 hypothetical protein GCM10011591_15690 [Nocardia camponoti]
MALMTQRWLRRIAVAPLAAGLVFATGCATGESGAAPGVTTAPCPNSPHKDRGCLYLGVLSDLADGPFTALGTSMNDGQTAFWHAVNEAGGIGGYDVDTTTYARNTAYDPRKHRVEYTNIEPHVLALAMSFGTAQTVAMLDQLDSDDMVATAATQWSGWNYRSADRNLVLSAGYSYCTEAITGLDWFAEAHYAPRKIAVVGYRGNFGGDYASGAMKWAVANDATIAARVWTGPNGEVGNQDEPVAEVLASAPDLVMLATGPAETAEIVGKLVSAGYTGRFVGSLVTWNSALLRTPAAPALTALYNYLTPVDSWDGDSLGLRNARKATDHEPTNFGYLLGWALSYPMRSVLQRAAAHNDLTRAGLRNAIAKTTADGEGMVAVQQPGAVAPDLSTEWASVFAPDQAGPAGSRTVRVGYQGKTATRLNLHEPCTRL